MTLIKDGLSIRTLVTVAIVLLWSQESRSHLLAIGLMIPSLLIGVKLKVLHSHFNNKNSFSNASSSRGGTPQRELHFNQINNALTRISNLKRVLMIKLNFRGNFYETSVPIQLTSDSTEQPKLKLIYRGYTLDYTPRPVVASKEVETEGQGQTVTLICRGNTYERKLQPLKPYQKPRAINWRWQ
jgi:hypothetical protein